MASGTTESRDLHETWLNDARDSVQERYKRSTVSGLKSCQTNMSEPDNSQTGSAAQRSQMFETFQQENNVEFITDDNAMEKHDSEGNASHYFSLVRKKIKIQNTAAVLEYAKAMLFLPECR